MLKTLENKNAREAESLLASVATRLLPQPDMASQEDELSESEAARLLQEIQADLRLDPADQSPEAKTKVLEFLYNEMSKPLKSGPRRDQARARLGQKGYLRPDMYRIRFGDSFHEREEKY